MGAAGTPLHAPTLGDRGIASSEERLSAVLRAVPMGIWEWDPGTRTLTWDDAMFDIYGVSRAAFPDPYLAWATAVHPDDRAHADACVEAALRDEREYACEFRIVRGDGAVRHIRAQALNRRGTDGSVQRMIGTNLDVTELATSEEARRESDEKFRLTFDVGLDAFYWATLEEGRIIEVNPAFTELFGYSREEAIGRTSLELGLYVHPEDRARLVAGVKAKGQVREMEVAARRKDGREFVASLSVTQTTHRGRQYLMGSIRDVTERKRVEALAREADRRFRAAFLTGADAYVIVQMTDGLLIEVNERFLELYGFNRDEVIGHTSAELGVWAEGSARARMLEVLRRDGRVDNMEVLARRKDGTTFPVLYSVTRLEGEGSELLVGAIRDMTEREQAQAERARLQQELNQAQKLESVGRLAGGVAHDFNNLLTVINASAQFVLDGLAPDAPAREDAMEILAAGERAVQLTRQLLAFSRRQVLDPHTCDINALVESTTKMLRRLIGEDVHLETQLSPSPILVTVDAGQVDQLLMNLAVNARDAMPGGGHLVIATDIWTSDPAFRARHPELGAGPLMRLRVRDTGCGMPPETLKLIFEPFFTTKPMDKGTGLGLSTVYGIVKQSGGAIEVESVVGQGSTFLVYLPLASATAIAERDDAGREDDEPPTLSGRETVLLVEDEASVRQLAERLLVARGYTVLSAPSAAEALRIVSERARPVDLLLTDVVMPGMNGYDLARELTTQRHCDRLLFMSGYTNAAFDSHGLFDPAHTLLFKPFTPETLARKVRDVLDRPPVHARP